MSAHSPKSITLSVSYENLNFSIFIYSKKIRKLISSPKKQSKQNSTSERRASHSYPHSLFPSKTTNIFNSNSGSKAWGLVASPADGDIARKTPFFTVWELGDQRAAHAIVCVSSFFSALLAEEPRGLAGEGKVGPTEVVEPCRTTAEGKVGIR